MTTYASRRKTAGLIGVALLVLFAGCSDPPPSALVEVEEFGSNPGALRMFKYFPESLRAESAAGSAASPAGRAEVSTIAGPNTAALPLVVALHGCMQDAAEYGESSGWIQIAERRGFLLLLPQQQRRNNLNLCFNWYSPADHGRDGGEALSIRQMIDRMIGDHPVDPRRIYVTGISAGAAMTLALAAAYPEAFAGAAPIAGIAFGCADGLLSGIQCMLDPPDKKAEDWGEAVRAASNHTGPWPRISVWQGGTDGAVDPANATTIVRQWTNVHGIEDTPEVTDGPNDSVRSLFRDPGGDILVESHLIENMSHGIPVDPGEGEDQCGTAGKFFPDVGICSSLHIADYWGLDR